MIRDLRKYAKQTIFQVIAFGLLLIIFVGVGFIYIIYGKDAALMGLACFFLGLSPLLLIAFVLFVLQFIVNKIEED